MDFNINVIKCDDHKFPECIRNDLEKAVKDSFATRRMVIVDGFFDSKSEIYPSNLSYLVVAYESVNSANIAGGAIVEIDEVRGENNQSLKFYYINKLFVTPEYQNNGLMYSLLEKITADGGSNSLFVLRTSDPRLSDKYESWSDISVEKCNFYIHGRNFLTEKGKERFADARKWFGCIEVHVDAKTRSVIYKANDRIANKTLGLNIYQF